MPCCCCDGCHEPPTGPAEGIGADAIQLSRQYCCECVPRQLCVSIVLDCGNGEETVSVLFPLICGIDEDPIHYEGEIPIQDEVIDLAFSFVVEYGVCTLCVNSVALALDGTDCLTFDADSRTDGFCRFINGEISYLEIQVDATEFCGATATASIRLSAADNVPIINRQPCLDGEGNVVYDLDPIRDLCGGCACICRCACITVRYGHEITSEVVCISDAEPTEEDDCEDGQLTRSRRYARWVRTDGIGFSLQANSNVTDSWVSDYADTAAQSGSNDPAWSNITDATGDTPSTYASASIAVTKITNILKLSDFDLAVDDTITGIIVEIEKQSTVADTIYDEEIRLELNGTTSPANRASFCAWPVTANVVRYGDSQDAWGYPASHLVPADFNDASFAVLISATNPAGATAEARVYRVRVTIYQDSSTHCCELHLGTGSIVLNAEPTPARIGQTGNRCPTPTATIGAVEEYTGTEIEATFECVKCNDCSVFTACCNGLIPKILTATITSADCDCAPVVVTIAYEHVGSWWIGTAEWCDSEVEIKISCSSPNFGIGFIAGPCVITSRTGVSGECSPMNLTEDLTISGISCCGSGHISGFKTITITITE